MSVPVDKRFQTRRKIPEMLLLVRFVAGPHVLKNAQISDKPSTMRNSYVGKNGATVAYKKRLN